ncbi:MAG: serine hydrolase domain-containing protein [Croceivirga sp.]
MLRFIKSSNYTIASAMFAISSLLNITEAFSQPEKTQDQRIDSLFARYSPDTPGVAVGIVKNGDLIFSKGYGSANLEYGIPITTKTVFHVASVSKQFTAFAIYLLKDQGLINLNDDVRKYLPKLPDYGNIIRIRHLLAHTSGLRDQWALVTLAGWSLEDVILTEQILKLVERQNQLNFTPGSQFGYCNTGYTLLAQIVKKVTGLSLAEYTQKHIFEPLGMNNTSFYDDFHGLVKNRAYSYERKNGQYRKKKLNYSNVGPTSLLTTVEDLAKWSHNFETSVVGNKALFNEFNQISRLDNGKPTIFNIINKDTLFHAKGQIHRNYRGIQMRKHGGHDAGYRSFLSVFPEEQISIITLSNDEHYEIFARGLDIAEFYLGNKMTPKKSEEQKLRSKTKEKKKEEISLQPFVGSFHSHELSTTYHIKIQENQLVISHQRLPNMRLTYKGPGKFSGNNYFDFEIDFKKNEDGTIIGFEISNFGIQKLPFEKISSTNH